MNLSCPVCLSSVKSNYTVLHEEKPLEQRHVFHTACLREWIKINPTCPVCRIDVVLESNYSLQLAGFFLTLSTFFKPILVRCILNPVNLESEINFSAQSSQLRNLIDRGKDLLFVSSVIYHQIVINRFLDLNPERNDDSIKLMFLVVVLCILNVLSYILDPL
jgi:hypothetical protein